MEQDQSTEKILVSACLAGAQCRYDGRANLHVRIQEWVKEGRAIPVCPEQLGGLPTPRIPAELTADGTQVINKAGEDVSEHFEKGAQATLQIALQEGVRCAILKSKSPSCGCGKVYDGTFSGQLREGDGITTRLLKAHGIAVKGEQEL